MCSRLARTGVHRTRRFASRPGSGLRQGMAAAASAPAAADVAAPEQPATAHAVTEKLLADDTYHIEFGGYLSNHAKHAAIGLYGLDSPPDIIRKYWDMCASSKLFLD
jgi:hypothetical protein